MKPIDNNPVAQTHPQVTSQNMEEAASKRCVLSGWRRHRLVSGVVVAVMVYVSGAITARVMMERGHLRIGSPIAQVLEFVYQPLKFLLDACPACRGAFESCAAVFASKGYHLSAQFSTPQTLKVGDPVMMAGVQIGYVESIVLDPARAETRVTMHIQHSAVVKTDSTATMISSPSPGRNSVVLGDGSPGAPDAVEGSCLQTREKPRSANENPLDRSSAENRAPQLKA